MGINRKRGREEQYHIQVTHRSFTTNLEGLRIFVSNVAPTVKKHDEALIRKITKTSEKILKVVGLLESDLKRKNKKIKTKLTEKQISEIAEFLISVRGLTPPQVGLLYESSFVMLISYFDFLISDLIHYFYQTYPESLSGKERSITLNELKFCNDLSEAVDYIVSREVNNVTYDSLHNQKKYFKGHLKIDTKENIIDWSKINEAMERRNIIVHNNGKINRRYLKNVDLSVIPEKKKDLKEGGKITINENYFRTVFDEVLIAGIILIQCCWRKWRKDDINSADGQLIEDVYDVLSKENWTVAEKLGLFSKECKVFNERNRLYLDVNYCQSLKWQNKKDELETELTKFDTSTLSPIYRVALYALKNDRDNFYENVEKAIIVDKMKRKDFKEWPLFRELRKDSAYEKKIETAFRSTSKKEQK